jgi:carbon monoxide dehydrogenase subunit G
MARDTVGVVSPWTPEQAFAYMADLRNFAKWDPGVSEAELVEGDSPGPGAAYRVKASRTTLRYETKDYRPDEMIYVVAKTTFFESLDRITVAPDGTGSRVVYDAELKLNGLLGIFDPLLKLAFNRIGDKAGTGLIAALEGRRAD